MSNIRTVLSMLEYADGCWYAVCPLCGRKFCFNDQYRAFIKQLRLINQPCEGEPVPKPVPPTPPVPPIIEYHISVSYNELEDCSAGAEPITVRDGETSTLMITASSDVEWSINITNATIIGSLSGSGNATLVITEIVGDVAVSIQFAQIITFGIIRYTATAAVSGTWIDNNTDTDRNTWDSSTNEGILYLNADVNTIGGGTSTSYSPFYNNSNIISTDLTDSNIVTIGNNAFQGCSNLAILTIGESVSTIGTYAFRNCTRLQTINFNATNCLTIGSSSSYAFNGCNSRTTINFGNNVTNIPDYAFRGLIGNGELTIPNSIVSIGAYAFCDCDGFSGTLMIPNSVTSIGNAAFYDCSGLTGILAIPNSIVNINNSTFANCSGLTAVSFSASVESIGNYAFDGCSGLTSIYIPETITSIGDGVFRSCNGLTSIVVSPNSLYYDSRNDCNAIIESTTDSLIAGCINTIIPDDVQSIGESAFNGISLVSFTLPDSVSTIGQSAFQNCEQLTSIDLGAGITNIGWMAFSSCSALATVYCRASAVPTLGNANFQANTNDTLYVPGTSASAYRANSRWAAAFRTITSIPNNQF